MAISLGNSFHGLDGIVNCYAKNFFLSWDIASISCRQDELPSQEFNAANPVIMPSGIEDMSDSDFELD